MYAVMAEGHSGKVHTLRKGFFSREDAEDHPVIASQWKRVWVEHFQDPIPDRDPSAPLPWTVLWQAGRAYIVDAKGRKIASLLGPQERRETVAAVVCSIEQRR